MILDDAIQTEHKFGENVGPSPSKQAEGSASGPWPNNVAASHTGTFG